MKRVVVMAFGMIFAVTPAGGQTPEKYFLDLTKPVARPDAQKSEPQSLMATGGATSAPFPVLSASLRIKKLNATVYRQGDPFVAVVSIFNSGRNPINIPWSTNRDLKYGKRPSANQGRLLEAGLGLRFTDDKGVTVNVFGVGLYGQASDLGTYRTLLPGEGASIKFGGPFYLGNAIINGPIDHKFSLPGEFLVRAAYSLRESGLANPFNEISSENELRVTVGK
jgi:hypothetical protein